MDHRLVAWGRSVKARRGGAVPTLWLFTDKSRGDVLRAVAGLPCGLCGVVFRHDGVAGRAALMRRVAAICRARRLVMVVAGAADGLPPGVGRHLRGGRGACRVARGGLMLTSSAHDRAELIRAARAGAAMAFVSPAFATASHPGLRPLGPVRWAAMTRGGAIPVFALGGVTGATVRRLPRWAAGAGAIGALLP